MISPQLLNSHAFRIALPLAVLCLFYWALYALPRAGSSSGADAAFLSPEESREILDLSRTRLREGDFEEALELTKKLHRAYPNNHVYVEQLATICGHLGRYKEEAEYWEKYLPLSPTPINACPQIGEAYRKQGLMQETIDACKRCLEFDGDNVESVFFLARACEQAGQMSKAGELYKRGVELSPKFADVQLGLARILMRQGRAAQAKEIAAEVLKENPDYVDALLMLGVGLRAEGKLAQAKEALAKGVELSPAYTDFYIVLGGIAEQESDMEQAIRHYDKVLELAPENRDIALRRSRLTGGQP